MKKYYLHDGNEQQGPFDLDELKEKNIHKDTHIWFEGLDDWTSAEKVDELKDLLKTSSPPPFGAKKTPPPVKKPPIKEKKIVKKNNGIYAIVGGLIIIGIIIGVFFYMQGQSEIKAKADERIREDSIKNAAITETQNRLENKRALEDSLGRMKTFLNNSKVALVNTKAQLDVENAQMVNIQGFHFLREQGDKNAQVRNQSLKIQKIEAKITDLNNSITTLENIIAQLNIDIEKLK